MGHSARPELTRPGGAIYREQVLTREYSLPLQAQLLRRRRGESSAQKDLRRAQWLAARRG